MKSVSSDEEKYLILVEIISSLSQICWKEKHWEQYLICRDCCGPINPINLSIFWIMSKLSKTNFHSFYLFILFRLMTPHFFFTIRLSHHKFYLYFYILTSLSPPYFAWFYVCKYFSRQNKNCPRVKYIIISSPSLLFVFIRRIWYGSVHSTVRK